MSASTPASLSESAYGLGLGRGDVEVHVIQTLRDWVVAYVADYERQKGLVPRSTPVPPTPESIHGGLDFETFAADLFPEIIVVAQPINPVERYGDGMYASWFAVAVGAIVTVEGDQDRSRRLADVYGTVLQKLLPEQGAFGLRPDGVTPFAERTRLEDAYGLAFPDNTVRDIVRATVQIRTFLADLVDDLAGPMVPPKDPYMTPLPPTTADKVEVELARALPGATGRVAADAVVLDGTVYPPVVRYEEEIVDLGD